MWLVFHEPWGWLDHHFTVQSQDMSCSYNPNMGNYNDWWSTPMTQLTHCFCWWDTHFSCWTIPSLLLESACLLLTHPVLMCFFWLRVNPNFTYSNFWIQAAWTTNMFLGHIPIPNEVKRCTPQKDPLTWRIIPQNRKWLWNISGWWFGTWILFSPNSWEQ